MKSFSHYCQKCRAANVPGEELCLKCGTPLMLVVIPPSAKHENDWYDSYSNEHLLERVSLLELRLMQIADRLNQALDLVLKQARTVQTEHVLVETLVDALVTSGIVEGEWLNRLWKDKQKSKEKQQTAFEVRERVDEEILAVKSAAKNDLFSHLVKEGFRLIRKDEKEQGLKTLEKAATIHPKNFRLLAYIGEHYFRTGKTALARSYLERAHHISSEDLKTILLLGVLLMDDGQTERARSLLEPWAEKSGFAINFVLGLIYVSESRLSEALIIFKRALAALPSAETHYVVGSIYAELGNFKLALRHLQNSIEADANYADAWYTLGIVYLQLSDEKAAKEALSMALAAREAGALCHAILKNVQKQTGSAEATFLLTRLRHVKKKLSSQLAPRLQKLLREQIELYISE